MLSFSKAATIQGSIGISSFAFQGTNAHAVLTAYSSNAEMPKQATAMLSATRGAIFHRQQFWYLPRMHGLTQGVYAKASEALVVAQLRRPYLGFLWDHRVQDNVLVPAAAMVEFAAAAGKLLLPESLSSGFATRCGLLGISLSSPCVLNGPGDSDTPALACAIHGQHGTFNIRSGLLREGPPAQATAFRKLHISGTIGALLVLAFFSSPGVFHWHRCPVCSGIAVAAIAQYYCSWLLLYCYFCCEC